MISIGDKAPAFELPANTGTPFNLAKAVSKKAVLLAFYPFDWSPVCTNELGYLNDNLDKYAAMGVDVVAISVDSDFCHKAWAKAEELKFPLLSDFNKDVCQRYGVLYENFAGLKGFAKRSVFLVDQKQVVRYAWVSEDPGKEPDYPALERSAGSL